MLEAGSVVSHDIGFPWEVLRDMAVAMLPLVFSGVDALFRCWAGRANSLLTDSRFGRGVVHVRHDSGVLDRVALGDEADLGEHAGVL